MSCRSAPRLSLVVLAVLIVLGTALQSVHAQVHVRGQYRNGKYVKPHYRSNPDGVFSNNWSTKGNINPYTGEEGTRVTPPRDYGGSGLRFSIHSFDVGTEDSYRESSVSSSSFSGTSGDGYSNWSYYPSDTGGEIWIENPHYASKNQLALPVVQPVDERTLVVDRFNYRGIGFDMTHDKFLHKFPTAKPTAPADAAGVISYAIDDLDRKADAVWFQFFDNEMYCIGFTYSNGRLQSNGGAAALLNKTKLQFGAPTREDGTQTLWLFPVADRSIAAGFDGSTWCTLITRTSLQQKIDRKKVTQVARE